MKRIKFLTVALAAFLVATSMNAQSTGVSAHVGYSPVTFSADSKSKSMTGLRIGVAAGNLASTSVPLYVDYGLNLNYVWDTKDEVKINYVSAAIPANIGYKLDVQGSALSFSPYGGLSARVNILAERKYDGESVSYFDGDNDNHWKRFQLGVQLGLKVTIGDKYIIGYEFNPNFMEIADNVKTTFNTFFVGIAL